MTVAYRSHTVGSGGAVSSVTPSAMPSGWQAGDLLVAHVFAKSATNNFNINTLTGWTASAEKVDSNGANRYRSRMFTRVAQAGDTVPTFTLTSSSIVAVAVTLVACSDANANALSSNSSYINGVPTNTAQAVPALTVPAQDQLLLSFVGASRGATTLNTSNSYTRDHQTSVGGSGGIQHGASHKSVSTANPAGNNWSITNGADFQQFHVSLGSDAVARMAQIVAIW